MEENNKNEIEGFSIDSEIERLNYLITASEENTSCYVSVNTENKEIVYSFNSQLSLTDEEELQLCWEGHGNPDIKIIKPNCVVRVEYELKGIKTIAECFLRDIWEEGDKFILNISGPYKMRRYQRRIAQRVGLNEHFPAMITLDSSKEGLSDLRVINISEGGAAILVSVPLELIEKEMFFYSAEITLPLKANNVFNVGVQVCHIKHISDAYLPTSLQGTGKYPWLQLGVKFVPVTPKMEHSLLMLMNQVLRSSK